MAMNVTSSTSSTTLQQPQQSHTQQAAAKTNTQQVKHAQPAPPAEHPKPVVNALGQTTGKRINVTA